MRQKRREGNLYDQSSMPVALRKAVTGASPSACPHLQLYQHWAFPLQLVIDNPPPPKKFQDQKDRRAAREGHVTVALDAACHVGQPLGLGLQAPFLSGSTLEQGGSHLCSGCHSPPSQLLRASLLKASIAQLLLWHRVQCHQ